MNGCVAELERLLLTGKSQMRVTEPFRGNWARAETVDGSYKLTDWTHAIHTVQTQVKSTVQLIWFWPIALFEIMAFANFVACYGLGLQRINTSLLWACPVPGTSTNQHLTVSVAVATYLIFH